MAKKKSPASSPASSKINSESKKNNKSEKSTNRPAAVKSKPKDIKENLVIEEENSLETAAVESTGKSKKEEQESLEATAETAQNTNLNNLKKAVVGSWVQTFTSHVKYHTAQAMEKATLGYKRFNKFQENNKTLINIAVKAPAVIGTGMGLFNVIAPMIGLTAISYGSILAPISAVALPFIVANPILVAVCATALAGALIGLLIYKIYKTEVVTKETTVNTATIEKVNSKDENKTVQLTIQENTIHKTLSADEQSLVKKVREEKANEKKASKKDPDAELTPKAKAIIKSQVTEAQQKISDKAMISDLAKEDQLTIKLKKKEVTIKKNKDNNWTVTYTDGTTDTMKKICNKMIEKLNVESRLQAKNSGAEKAR